MKKGKGDFWLYVRIGSLNLGVLGMFYTINQPFPMSTVSTVTPQIHVKKIVSGVPNRLVLSSLGMDLPVGLGTYDKTTDSWSLDLTKAYYADVSVPVNNNNGVTLIYGHGQKPIFGNLPEIKSGAEAVVYTDSGYAFHYKYQTVDMVDPKDTSVFKKDGPPTLVLQTCAGDFDKYRALYRFNLIGYEKA